MYSLPFLLYYVECIFHVMMNANFCRYSERKLLAGFAVAATIA